MQNYDFGQAVFHFFRTFARRPGGTLWVMAWNALVYLVLGALVLWALWPFYQQIFTLALMEQEPGASEVFSMLWSVTGALALMTLGSLVIALMAQGAWLRLLARDEIARGIPLRFGGDEVRLLGVNILFLVFGTVLYMTFVGIVAGAVIVTAATNDGGGGAAGIVAGLAGFLAFLVFIAVGIFLAIKFAPAPALSVLDRRFRFFDAWPATRGIFWWALLSYFVMILIIFAAATVLGTLVQFFFLPAVFPVAAEFIHYAETGTEPTPQEALDALWAGLTHPVAIISIAIGMVMTLVMQTVYEGLWHSVGAYLARRHRGLEGPPATPASPPVKTGDAGGDSGSTPA